MKYERLTERRETPLVMSMWPGDSESLKVYNRLATLEDKIEKGELISTVQDEQSEQEIAFFAKHNDEVRKDTVKECLQVLCDTGMTYLYDTYSWEGIEVIDQAIKRLAEKYNIDVKGGKGMKDAEKYAEELAGIPFSELAMTKDGKICRCEEILCRDCAFYERKFPFCREAERIEAIVHTEYLLKED